MFGSLGAPELLFIMGLALLIFGPSKLPELGRTMGKAMAEFRKAATDFKRTLNAEALEREMREVDPRRAVNDTLAKAKKDLDDVLNPKEQPAAPASATEETETATGTTTESVQGELVQREDDGPRGAAGTVARGSSDESSGDDRSGDETPGDGPASETQPELS